MFIVVISVSYRTNTVDVVFDGGEARQIKEIWFPLPRNEKGWLTRRRHSTASFCHDVTKTLYHESFKGARSLNCDVLKPRVDLNTR